MTTNRVDHDSELSATYLGHARALLSEGDLPEASEKAWGAVAVALKACAEARGLRHSRHGHLGQMVTRLIEETGDRELQDLFSYAESLHANYYEDYMLAMVVEEYVGHAEQLTAKLGSLRDL